MSVCGSLHCNENPIYVSPEKELRDLYIPRIDPHIFLQQNRQTEWDTGILIARTHVNVEIGTEVNNSFSGNICFEFSVLCLCSVATVYLGISSSHPTPSLSLGSVKIFKEINPFHTFAAVKIYDFRSKCFFFLNENYSKRRLYSVQCIYCSWTPEI
jgi:hypothetical protein